MTEIISNLVVAVWETDCNQVDMYQVDLYRRKELDDGAGKSEVSNVQYCLLTY